MSESPKVAADRLVGLEEKRQRLLAALSEVEVELVEAGRLVDVALDATARSSTPGGGRVVRAGAGTALGRSI